MTPKWIDTYQELGEALKRFKEMVDEPEDKNTYVIDATIQRFEFCIELFWKCLKKICESEGVISNSPKQTLQEAFAMKLIDDEQIWLNMMADRNRTSHTYHQPLARSVFQSVKTYYPTMQSTYAALGKRYNVAAKKS